MALEDPILPTSIDAEPTADPSIQVFDDGSSLQTFDDGRGCAGWCQNPKV